VWLSHLDLRNFRNISGAALDLSPGFNFFHGLNGAGKTAVLEAVHVLGRGRSFRTQQLQDLIQTGQDGLLVRAVAEDEHVGTQRLVFSRHRGGRTELRINGEAGSRMSQLAALVPMEVMTPSMVDLVFAGPSLRRQWLDWGVFHVKHDYLVTLRRYMTALRQRNACLKSLAGGRLQMSALEPWTLEVAQLGDHVSGARLHHLDGIRGHVTECLQALSTDFEVEIIYRRGWPEGEELANVLGESVAREVKSGATGMGPHRADVEFRVHGQLCSATLSRGQAKLLASALMLAQADLVERSGIRSGMFLIDDIGAELDERHRNQLFQALLLRHCQVLATSVELPAAGILEQCPGHALFHVEQGRIARI